MTKAIYNIVKTLNGNINIIASSRVCLFSLIIIYSVKYNITVWLIVRFSWNISLEDKLIQLS